MAHEPVTQCINEIEIQVVELIDSGLYEKAAELVNEAINRLLQNRRVIEAELAAMNSRLH